MKIIPETPDPTGDAIKKVNEAGYLIACCLSKHVTRCIAEVAPINDIFWSDPRIGAGGAALLQKLGAHVALIATHFPTFMNATLASAGSTLNANPDGTVTHTPPEPD